MTIDESYKLVGMMITAFSTQKAVKEIPEQTIDLYAYYLATIPLEAGQAAIIKLITNKDFFPTIAEIKKAVQGFTLNISEPPPAELAWEEVRKQLDPYKAPTWSHSAIERAVRALGFRNLCFTSNPGQDMARFMKVYDAYRQREIDQVENESIRQITSSVMKQLPGGAA